MIPVDSFYQKLNSVRAVVVKRKDDFCLGISWEILRHIHKLVCWSQLFFCDAESYLTGPVRRSVVVSTDMRYNHYSLYSLQGYKLHRW